MKDFLSVSLVYDRSINPQSGDQTIDRLCEALLLNAPEWSRNVTAWEPQRSKRQTIDLTDTGLFAHLICERTRTLSGPNTGSVDLRGQKRDFAIVVRVGDKPLHLIGGKLLMNNSIWIEVFSRKIEGVDADLWAERMFRALAESTAPVWGAVYMQTEYWEKVMETKPSIWAVGRDFSRFLPGLFAVNYFGQIYVKLMGESAFHRLAARGQAASTGSGWVVNVAPPRHWNNAEMNASYAAALETLGGHHFFDNSNKDAPTSAPSWPHPETL
jgi:hypothetical protein